MKHAVIYEKEPRHRLKVQDSAEIPFRKSVPQREDTHNRRDRDETPLLGDTVLTITRHPPTDDDGLLPLYAIILLNTDPYSAV